MGNLDFNQQNLNTVAWVPERDQGSSHHPPPSLDQRTLDAHITSLLSRVTAGEHELKQAKEDSAHVSQPPRTRSISYADRNAQYIQELEAGNRDLSLHIEGLEDGLRKQKAIIVTLRTREASPRTEIRDLKEDYVKVGLDSIVLQYCKLLMDV